MAEQGQDDVDFFHSDKVKPLDQDCIRADSDIRIIHSVGPPLKVQMNLRMFGYAHTHM